jgi:hypothetical protein
MLSDAFGELGAGVDVGPRVRPRPNEAIPDKAGGRAGNIPIEFSGSVEGGLALIARDRFPDAKARFRPLSGVMAMGVSTGRLSADAAVSGE